MKINKNQILYIIIFALIMSHVPWINWYYKPTISQGKKQAIEFGVTYKSLLERQKLVDSINAIYDAKEPIVVVREVINVKWRDKTEKDIVDLDSLDKVKLIISNFEEMKWKN